MLLRLISFVIDGFVFAVHVLMDFFLCHHYLTQNGSHFSFWHHRHAATTLQRWTNPPTQGLICGYRVHLCIFTPIYHHVLVIIIAVLGYSASPLSHCVDLAKLWFPALMIHIFVCALHADKSATPHYQSPFLANLGYHRPSSASDTVAR